MKQVVEKIDEKLADRSQFSTADLNRYLGFDAVKFVRNLVGRKHLAGVGKGVFERAAWPPPATLLEGEPIGLTYCVQTWFKYYLQQWITRGEGLLSHPAVTIFLLQPARAGWLATGAEAVSCVPSAAARKAS